MKTVISIYAVAPTEEMRSQFDTTNPIAVEEIEIDRAYSGVDAAWLDEDADNDLTAMLENLQQGECLSLDEDQIAVLFADFERSISEEKAGSAVMTQWDRFRETVESEFDESPDDWLAENILILTLVRA